MPNITKLTALLKKLGGELAQFNRASLYGLLNFYREYFPAFSELVKPLHQLLGQTLAHRWQQLENAFMKWRSALLLHCDGSMQTYQPS